MTASSLAAVPLRGDIQGVVLAGGKSRRLGQDKARLMFCGEDLLAHSARLLGTRLSRVAVVGRDPAPQGLHLPWLADEEPGLGPIGGIVTALAAFGRPCLVLSCDLPFLTQDELGDILAARDRALSGEGAAMLAMTTFLQTDTGFIESLVALYEPAALPLLREAAGRGQRKLSSAVPPEARACVPYGPERAMSFFNVNFPADLAVMRRLEEARP